LETDDITDNPAVRAIVLFCASLLLWVLLTGSLADDELMAGVMVAAAVALLAWNSTGILAGIRLTPAAAVALLRYLGYFLVALVRANLDMARRVLAPSLPLNPEVVEVHTGLRSDLGKLLLANSITLTPGTLSVDVVDDRILVHWIDCPAGADMAAATTAIAAGFERRIGGFLK
jgi:multicomponent Na+:H+ antiporter subunit E